MNCYFSMWRHNLCLSEPEILKIKITINSIKFRSWRCPSSLTPSVSTLINHSFILLKLSKRTLYWIKSYKVCLKQKKKKIRDRPIVSSILCSFTCSVQAANVNCFCFDFQNWQNTFGFTTCTKHVNQHRIGCQILA